MQVTLIFNIPLGDDDIFSSFLHCLLWVRRKAACGCLRFRWQNRRCGRKRQSKVFDHGPEVLYLRSILELRQLHVEASGKNIFVSRAIMMTS